MTKPLRIRRTARILARWPPARRSVGPARPAAAAPAQGLDPPLRDRHPAAVYLYSERLTKTYSSSVIVQPQATTDLQAILSGGGTTRNLAGVASLAGTPSVVAEAARIQHKPISSIRGVTASSDEDTGFVTIEVGERASKPNATRGVAEALARRNGRQADTRR